MNDIVKMYYLNVIKLKNIIKNIKDCYISYIIEIIRLKLSL